MANKGCNNCKFYKIGELRMWEDDIPRSCQLGKTVELESWWVENGHKVDVSEIIDMPCFEATTSNKLLCDINNLLDELRDAIVSKD